MKSIYVFAICLVVLLIAGSAQAANPPMCPHVIYWGGGIATWAQGAPWIKVIGAGEIPTAQACSPNVFYRPYDADSYYHDDGCLPANQTGAQYADLVWAKISGLSRKPEAVGYRNEFNWDNPTQSKRTCAEFVNYKNRLRQLGYTGKIIFGSFGVRWVDSQIWDDPDLRAATDAADGIETHEYFDLTVDCCAPWLAFRHRDIAIANHPDHLGNKEWYIGEFGSDRVCGNCSSCDDDLCRRGWRDNNKLSEQAYINQMAAYRAGCANQVVAVFVFQQGSGGWWDFETMGTAVADYMKSTWTVQSGSIAGNVKDSNGANLSGATVTTNTGGYSATSDANGNYVISNVNVGTYDVTASKTGYTSQTQTGKTVTANQTTTVNFTLACTAPAITTQPASQTKCSGQSVTFTVAASGSAPLSYQWKKNGSNISGATSSSYTISTVTSGDAGNYTCYVSNACGNVTSNAATLTVKTPPSITTQPVSQTKNVGESCTFSVVASGTTPLTYQWRKGGTNISGATSSSYTISSVQLSDAGNYDCIVTNSCGSVTSSTAVLTVNGSGTLVTENFEVMPSWSSSFDASWGSAATWSIVSGGQSGNFLQAARSAQGSSVKALVYAVPANTNITISGYMKCPSFGGSYWMEFGYRLGSYSAQDFDVNSGSWTLIKKFANSGYDNGNGNTWTKYSATVNTGSSTQVTIGYKLGSSGGAGPTVGWDTFRIDSSGCTAPSITTQPTSQTKSVGQSVTFTVVASGTAPLSYQWRKNGSNIPGATSSSYTIASVQTSDAGNYDCVVSNGCGSATSNVAVLTVTGGTIASEDFETMPSWSSSFDASWGSAATWSIVSGGQSGNFLQVARGSQGSSSKVKVYTVPTNTNITVSVYMKCPSFGGSYWMESAYRLGNYSAGDFDANSSSWTFIKKFANDGVNGNGNTWTNYSVSVNTGSNTQISIGYKLGSSGGAGPTVGWDTFRIQ